MFQKVVCLCGLRPRRQEKIDKEYCMSLRTAMIVFVKCRSLLSVGDMTVNVSSGRMFLRTAATKTREDLKAIVSVFADCHGCVW